MTQASNPFVIDGDAYRLIRDGERFTVEWVAGPRFQREARRAYVRYNRVGKPFLQFRRPLTKEGPSKILCIPAAAYKEVTQHDD